MSNKILIHRNETVDDVVEKIRGIRADEVVVVVPKGSVLRSGAHVFEYIRDEAASEGKSVRIESTDEEIVSMARASGMVGSHPFFAEQTKGSSFSDIVPASNAVKRAKNPEIADADEDDEPNESSEIQKGKHVFRAPAAEAVKNPRAKESHGFFRERRREEDYKILAKIKEEDEAFELLKQKVSKKMEGEIAKFAPGEKPSFARELPDKAFKEDAPSRAKGFIKKTALAVFVGLILAGVWAAGNFMAKAKVQISSKTTPWEGSVNLMGTISQKTINLENSTIPVEYFENTKSYTLFTDATGKKDVSQKAAGTITIVNEYSSAPQPLVATTRFQLPDGRIYRLSAAVTVPGAKIQDGKIIASSIEAKIAADQPGDSYNTTSTDILKIPGFKGGPKYDKFYGKGIFVSGGFTGQKAYPVDADTTAAKAKMTETLTAALKSDILNSRSGDFKVLDNASDIAITRMQISPDVNDQGQFGTIASGAYRAIGFRENDIKQYLLAQALGGEQGATSSSKEWRNLEIEYADVKVDMENRNIRMTIKAKGVLQKPFDESAFRDSIKGKSLAEAKSVLLQDPGVAGGSISVWPFWVSKVPQDARKINVNKD